MILIAFIHNLMLGNNSFPVMDTEIQKPFLYILDIRNFTWVTQFEPERDPALPNGATKIATSSTGSTNSPTSPPNLTDDNGKKTGIIVGVFGVCLAVSTIAGFLGFKLYKNYKKQQSYNHAIP